MKNSGAFFDQPEGVIERHKRTGEPLIHTPDGKQLYYTRASSLGDYLTDQAFLEQWHMRNLAVALGRRRDLADLAAIEPYNTGLNEPPSEIKAASAKRLDGYINRALDYVAIEERADRGTVVHAVTEMGYDSYVPHTVIGEKAAFDLCLVKNKIVRLASELFTVNDRLRVAGTFDHLLYHPVYGIIIGDTKNGRNDNNLGFSIQFANYANSVLYYWVDGVGWVRMTLEEYVATKFPEVWELAGKKINRELAVLFSVKDRECKPKDVDIAWGYQQALLAADVRDARGSEAGKVMMSKEIKKVAGREAHDLLETALLEWISTCNSVEMLRILWRDYKDNWTPQLTNAAAQRKAELS